METTTELIRPAGLTGKHADLWLYLEDSLQVAEADDSPDDWEVVSSHSANDLVELAYWSLDWETQPASLLKTAQAFIDAREARKRAEGREVIRQMDIDDLEYFHTMMKQSGVPGMGYCEGRDREITILMADLTEELKARYAAEMDDLPEELKARYAAEGERG